MFVYKLVYMCLDYFCKYASMYFNISFLIKEYLYKYMLPFNKPICMFNYPSLASTSLVICDTWNLLYHNIFIFSIYVLLKALPPVCMKYTARGESRVANIVRGEAKCYICHETLTMQELYISYK